MGAALAAAITGLSGAAQAQLSSGDAAAYTAAFAAADSRDWATANRLAGQAGDPVLVDVVRWTQLSQADPDTLGFDALNAMLQTHPGWPRTDRLRRRAEEAMSATLPADARAAWFDRFPALTANGLTLHLDALVSLGRQGEAIALLRDRWPDIGLGEVQQAFLLNRYGSFLTEDDHWRRLDTLAWRGRSDEARHLYPQVDAGRRALVEARLRLAASQPGVDDAIAAVPAALMADEGLVFERLRWRRRQDMTDRAIELLPQEPQGSSYARSWWTERHILARRLFNDRDYAGAYAVASQHRQTAGFPLAQAEWFSGFLALRFLGQPDLALPHFQRLYGNVTSPISLSRGAYWTARSHEARGDTASAEQWYAVAAQHNTTFYGQLAAERLGRSPIDTLPAAPPVSADAATRFNGDERAPIATALTQIGRGDLAELFLLAMLDTAASAGDMALVGDLAVRLGNRFIAVRAGKRAASLGVTLPDLLYPVLPLTSADARLDPALALALIRQESEFRVTAVSSAGARGLMQLMPTTASSVAGQLGVTHSTTLLTTDPQHNIRLGSRYLADRLSDYGGSAILAAAAYNAGSGRVRGWLNALGDPRSPAVDSIDWIESLTIYETRNYVQRVLEGVQVYRARLGTPGQPGSLSSDLGR